MAFLLKAYKTKIKPLYNEECISCTQPNNDPDAIVFTEYWKVNLHPFQDNIGSCLITSLRHVPRICDLTNEEATDFHKLYSVFEPALERSFGANLINISCLRNWAYRRENPQPSFKNGKPNPHVHWHVIPRYSKDITFEGLVFTDPTFGEPYDGTRKMYVHEEIRENIIQRIRSELEIQYV